MKTLLFLSFVLGFNLLFSQEPIHIRLKVDAPHTLSLSYAVKTNMDMKADGKRLKLENNIGMRASLSTLKIQADTLDMNLVYQQMSMDMKMSMAGESRQIISVNTDSVEEDPITRIFTTILDKSIGLKFTQDGHLHQVSGFNELVESMTQELEFNERQQEIMNSAFNEEQTRSQMAQMFAYLPKAPVRLNDTWEWVASTVIQNGSTIIGSQGIWKLVEVQNDKLRIEGTRALSMNTTKSQNGQGTKMNLSGTENASFWVSRKTGLPISQTDIFNLTGTMKVGTSTSPLKMVNTVTVRTEEE
jgi:Family of unknown function (DUF6263)